MQKYSVFISYRRTGFETANLIAEKLRSIGYSVFFDVESLRGGKFNEQLFQVIDKCTDMVLVLPKDALDRCADKDDWVRKEVMYAMLKQKNIVPVMLNDFDWPNPMPSGMEDLKDYQAVTASERNTFDLAMQRLASYLKAPRRNRIMVTRIIGIIALVLILLGILFGVLRLSSLPVCKKAANEMCYNVGLIHQIYEIKDRIYVDWQEYLRTQASTQSIIRKQDLKDDLTEQTKQWETNIALIRSQARPQDGYTPIESMLLASRGLFTIELQCEKTQIESFCDDIDSLCVHIRQALEGTYQDTYEERRIQMDIDVATYCLNAYYYAYLSELSHIPSSAREMHRIMSTTWTLFPTESDNQSARYYDEKMMKEFDKANQIIANFGNYVNQQDSEINKLGQQLDELEKQIDAVSQTNTHDVDNQLHKTQEERVQMKGELVKQKKAQLAETEKQVEEVYSNILQSCQIAATDAESYQWGKICHLAEMLQLSVNSRRANPNSVISPNRVLCDLKALIDSYVTLHPESNAYMPSLKVFYQLVAEDKAFVGGQLVFAFLKGNKNTMDNVHKLYHVGDIIVKRNNQSITDYQSMVDAASSTPVISNGATYRGTVSYYRLEHNALVLHHDSVPNDTTILVGYRNVGE